MSETVRCSEEKSRSKDRGRGSHPRIGGPCLKQRDVVRSRSGAGTGVGGSHPRIGRTCLKLECDGNECLTGHEKLVIF